jgi:hypothetical protein
MRLQYRTDNATGLLLFVHLIFCGAGIGALLGIVVSLTASAGILLSRRLLV